MSILTSTSVHENANEIEPVLFSRFCWISKVVDLVWTDIKTLGKSEMIVDLSPTEVVQIEFEPLEVKDEIVGGIFEARSKIVSQ